MLEYTFDLGSFPDGLGVSFRASNVEFIGYAHLDACILDSLLHSVRVLQIALDSPASGTLQINDQIVMVCSIHLSHAPTLSHVAD